MSLIAASIYAITVTGMPEKIYPAKIFKVQTAPK